jgi:cytochrome P450
VTITLAELETDPHPALARLRAAAPVAWVEALGGWLVTSRELVLAVMRDAETFTVDDPRFSTARVVGPSMLSRDGAEHARHRDPFARAFRLATVRDQLGAFVADEAVRLVDALPPGGAELRRGLAGPLAVAVVARSLGLGGAEPATVLRWYDAIVAGVSGVAAGRPVPDEAHAAFAELATAVGAELDSAGPPTLLRAAATGSDLEPTGDRSRGTDLSPDEVVSNAAVIMFGGIETTEGMIANAILHLLAHPDQLELVRTDPELLAGAIEESLRLEPAAAVVDRYATRDIELGGAAIRAGDFVVVSLAGANRDPAAFTDPNRFDVRRPEARLQVGFAHGPHVCPGMHLARLEARAAIAALLEARPGVHLDPDRPATVRGLVFRKPPELYVRF